MFKSASSEKKEGILRFMVQLDKLSPRVVKNTCPNSASAGLAPSAGSVTRGGQWHGHGFHRQVFSWDGKGYCTSLTPFKIKQWHPSAIYWPKDAIGVLGCVQQGLAQTQKTYTFLKRQWLLIKWVPADPVNHFVLQRLIIWMGYLSACLHSKATCNTAPAQAWQDLGAATTLGAADQQHLLYSLSSRERLSCRRKKN